MRWNKVMNGVWELDMNIDESIAFQEQTGINTDLYDITKSKASYSKSYYISIRPNFKNPLNKEIMNFRKSIKAKDLGKEIERFKYKFEEPYISEWFKKANEKRHPVINY